MLKKYINILSLIFTLLLATLHTNAQQLYVEGYGGVNTFTLSYSYNFTGNIGLGYTNRKIKIGVELGLGTGVPYKKPDIDPSGEGGVTFSDYTNDSYYSTTNQKKIVTYSGNLYPQSNSKLIFSNQLLFGLNSQWHIIKTFTANCPHFDIGIFSGIGFGYYHTTYNTKIMQPYMKAGIELNFNAKDFTFIINADIRYFAALNGINYQTNEYHSYIQQTVNAGIRYNIPLTTSTRGNSSNKNNNNAQPIQITNNIITNCGDSNNSNDTVTNTIMLPVTILFANDRYDIRKTEYDKLNNAANYIKQYNLKAQIIGMASNVGTHKHNQTLSFKRCQAVYNYLVNNDVFPNQLEIIPLGDNNSEPIEEPLDRCVIIKFE